MAHLPVAQSGEVGMDHFRELPRPLMFEQVVAIAGLWRGLPPARGHVIDVPHAPGDFFDASNL